MEAREMCRFHCFLRLVLSMWFYCTCEVVMYGRRCLQRVGVELLTADVKPSNILVNTQGNVKLCDFGVSVQVSYISQILPSLYQFKPLDKRTRSSYATMFISRPISLHLIK